MQNTSSYKPKEATGETTTLLWFLKHLIQNNVSVYFSVQYSYYSYSLSFKSIWWKQLSFVRHWALHYSWHQLQIYTIIKSLPDESYSIPLGVGISESVHMCLSSQQLSRWASAITVTRRKKKTRIVAPQLETKMAWDRKDNVFLCN